MSSHDVAGRNADVSSISPHHHPIAVVLDLMNPARAARGLHSASSRAAKVIETAGVICNIE